MVTSRKGVTMARGLVTGENVLPYLSETMPTRQWQRTMGLGIASFDQGVQDCVGAYSPWPMAL